MGMFDYITAETSVVKGEFQTKSADCLFDRYKITDEFLFIHKNDKWYKHPWFTDNLEFHTYHVDTKVYESWCAEIIEGNVIRIWQYENSRSVQVKWE